MTDDQQAVPGGDLAEIQEINSRAFPGRMCGYFGLSGPGFIQSAITLGASTATSSFYLGWRFGYSMLWVQILGMLMGVVMFAAVARPTLYRRESILSAMSKYVHPVVAYAWVGTSIVASMFWCMNQYSTAVPCLEDVGVVSGVISEAGSSSVKWGIGAVILAVSIGLTWSYGSEKNRGVRIYETMLKFAIAFMVLCFAAIAWKTGIEWSSLGAGLVPNPKSVWDLEGHDLTMVLGALGCSVGINMTFLFPITLRARGWGKDHLGLSRFDLVSGMFVPFAIISTLVVVAAANVLSKYPEAPKDPVAVAKVMESLFEGVMGRVLFDLGVAAMPLSTVTILMLICGLGVCELMGRPHKGLPFKIGALLPAVGILGSVSAQKFWLGPLISSFGLILLPIAYFGFIVLHNSRSFLGDDMPTGGKRLAWNVVMGIILCVTISGAVLKLIDVVPKIFA